MARRAYDLVRSMVEEHNGQMKFVRKGYPPGGAWVVTYKTWANAYPTIESGYPLYREPTKFKTQKMH